MTLPANITATTQTHLDSLIHEKAEEGQHLDFKREIPAAWDGKAKHDLVSDASAFANAGGGWLIYGMEQDDIGCAKALSPSEFNPDTGTMQMESILRDNIEPRLPVCRVQPVKVNVGGVEGYAVVVEVPQSWQRPHRARTNRDFYLRVGKQSRPVDVPELKGMVLRSEGQAQRIRDFRTERLARILSRETPCPFKAGPALVVHAVPTAAALGTMQIDPVIYERNQRRTPMLGRTSAAMSVLNFDGVVSMLSVAPNESLAYTQIFREGYFEAAWALQPIGGSPRPALVSTPMEHYVFQFLEGVRVELAYMDVPVEMAVFVSILGADEVDFATDGSMGIGVDRSQFDRKMLNFPEVVIEADVLPSKGMRPVYDRIWQSANLRGSLNYDKAGNWRAAGRA